MNLRFPKALAEAIGEEELKPYGADFQKFRWGETSLYIDVRPLSKEMLDKLVGLVKQHLGLWGAKSIILDIETWAKALATPTKVKPKNVSQFYSVLLEYIRKAPGHRIYTKDSDRDTWMAYYVGKIEYHKPQKTRDGGTIPDYVTMDLYWSQFGGRQEEAVHFRKAEITNMTVVEALARSGYVIESDSHRERYLQEVAKFNSLTPQIGLQCAATGFATDDVDGNAKLNAREERWSGREVNTFRLDKDGPSKVVIDVFRESEKNDRDRDSKFNPFFWSRAPGKEDDEDDDEMKEDAPEIEIPLHPWIVIFDLKKHLRLKVHVVQAEVYKYDRNLGDKLVLPEEVRSLVDILLAHKGGFKDIIEGKGTGAIILCAGPPGTGKTLTAEVYSEVSARPLYNVQCSQLGVSPEDLEDELLRVFARSARWNAILLLDEADVYVRARGEDLNQNAIVGVFLRTLEYYKGILFLTTNRAEMVDDAILSRCIARIVYEVPDLEDQRRIWRILADTGGVKISNDVIKEFSGEYPHLSGRDIKNLLKLASLVAASSEEEVTAATLDFVLQFKPTD